MVKRVDSVMTASGRVRRSGRIRHWKASRPLAAWPPAVTSTLPGGSVDGDPDLAGRPVEGEEEPGHDEETAEPDEVRARVLGRFEDGELGGLIVA